MNTFILFALRQSIKISNIRFENKMSESLESYSLKFEQKVEKLTVKINKNSQWDPTEIDQGILLEKNAFFFFNFTTSINIIPYLNPPPIHSVFYIFDPDFSVQDDFKAFINSLPDLRIIFVDSYFMNGNTDQSQIFNNFMKEFIDPKIEIDGQCINMYYLLLN